MALRPDTPIADFFQLLRAAQHARRRAAKLHVPPADRREIEHRIKSRDFEHADIGHAENVGDALDGRLRQPIIVLFLSAPKQRDHRRVLPPRRIFGDLLVGPSPVFGRELETRRLFLSQSSNRHALSLYATGAPPPRNVYRSTSPKTMSSDPKIADTSASMCLRHMKSIACRCVKPGALSLTRYGLLAPSETRYTPNSPLGASTAA